MSFGLGMIVGHYVTLRRLVRTFFVGHGRTLARRGGGDGRFDLWPGRPRKGEARVVSQDDATEGLFTVEYPDERLPVRERTRVLPMLIYDEADGHVRCTSCNICAKVCPPQCIWMVHAETPEGRPVALPEEFFVDMDICMNCGLCAEYCPFDAIKMDQNFELANSERHRTHIFGLADLLVSSAYYAETHPEAFADADEVGERDKVARRKDRRLQKALGMEATPGSTPPPASALRSGGSLSP